MVFNVYVEVYFIYICIWLIGGNDKVMKKFEDFRRKVFKDVN